MEHPRHLELGRVRNVRDLGGYSYHAEDGSCGSTAYGVLLRGPSLCRLREEDVAALDAYGRGLRCVIDLRSDFEVGHWRDPYARGRDGVAYVHVPMLDQLNSGGFRDALPDRMLTVYKSLLDNDHDRVREVMMAIDEQGEGGCTLFHCRAGKDRTGLIAMLLLGLAGVSDEDIIADYAATQLYLGRGLRAQRLAVSIALFRRAPRCLFEAVPEEMALTVDHLHHTYGTARGYLEGYAGVPSDVLDRIAGRLRGEASR